MFLVWRRRDVRVLVELFKERVMNAPITNSHYFDMCMKNNIYGKYNQL